MVDRKFEIEDPKMEAKPIPKPRSIVADRPIPAPRRMLPSLPSRIPHRSDSPSQESSQESSQSEKSDDTSRSLANDSPTRNSTNNEFFRSLSTSSRQLKDEISEKMTVKGRAVISSTRNASIRLEKSVKNLLARRLTSLSHEEKKAARDPVDDDRCVSMPTADIFSTISFYSPISGNLRSVKNEEDLSSSPKEMRQSPPPPVYPPPPLPDESIYDELQSVASGSSGRYDTLGSTLSDSISDSFDLLAFARNQASDSDQSLNLSDVNVGPSNGDTLDAAKKLSRSVSWTFYDSTPAGKCDAVDEPDRTFNEDDEPPEQEASVVVGVDRSSIASNASRVSLPNSIYENCLPPRKVDEDAANGADDDAVRDAVNDASDEDDRLRKKSPSADRQESSRSLLFEFDPFARRSEENVYGNYENNDLMLLEALLAPDGNPELREEFEDEETSAAEDDSPGLLISLTPPEPPKRYDSLPKGEYNGLVDLDGGPERIDESAPSSRTTKNPPLLPKLAHMAKRKQPAVPPRRPSVKMTTEPSPTLPAKAATPLELRDKKSGDDDRDNASATSDAASSPMTFAKGNDEQRRAGVIQKLKMFRQGSTAHVINPNVISFVKSGGKLLSRNRDHSAQGHANASARSASKMRRPSSSGSNDIRNSVSHRGVVYRAGVGIERAKDLVQRAAVLADRKISLYADKSLSTLKEVLHLDTAHSVHLLQDAKVIDGETVHCIAISGEGRPNVHVFYAKGVAERRIWAQRILEAMTPVFSTKYTADLTRAGWAYLKEGVTGTWFPAWLLLQQRTLIYTKSMEPVTFEQLDLRKGRCIVLREEEGPSDAGTGTNVPVVVVDAVGTAGGALHVAAPGSREGPAWRHALHQAATNCGPALDEQQLTQDNVPVILDKCINFIYAHGIMSEGIYRRSGSSSAVVRLLETFRRDAWATQITRGSYTEHDVATVLRRFLRDLPEPLFPACIHDHLCRTSEIGNEDEKASMYRKTLSPINPVASATIRRILAHLHCLSLQSARNLMTVENLSAVWGPTLMHAGESSAEDWNRSETKVIGDLIKQYPKLYQLSRADLAKEAKMLEVLERHHISNSGLRGAPSGDLKIWIYVFSRDGECVNVTIGPQKTAFDVCKELADRANLPPHELCLEEYTLSGALERPLHHTERVLEAVARWGYWDPEDRKDNVLVLKKDSIYKDIVPLVKPPMTISGELKFADVKTKNFKNYLFEFSQAKLCCYKDKVCSVKLHEWKIEDIVWYLGHEPKRSPQMGWSITFIVKNQKPIRCKDSPYFGNTLAGVSRDEQYRWIAAFFFGEYQMNLRPSVVNLMDP